MAGHSHINALVGERYEAGPKLRDLAGYEDADVLDGRWPRDNDYWSTLAETAVGRRVGLVWGGNEHNSLYFLQAHPFDFASKHVPGMLDKAQVVPQRTLRQRLYESGVSALDYMLAKLSGARSERVIVIGTPPPKKDNDKLRALLEREPVFVSWAQNLNATLDTVGITHPRVRLKLWYLLQDLLREAAEKRGAAFLPVARELQDEEGFLREELWAPDVTHANAEYGRVMLEAAMGELRA